MNELQMTLGRDWQGEDPAGWYLTEKLDGCRAYWDGSQLWTRGGNLITAPRRLTDPLPRGIQLDGELYAGRGQLELARRAVQYNDWNRRVRFVVHDCPTAIGNYAARMKFAGTVWNPCVAVTVCASRHQLIATLRELQARNGEGLVLRNPAVVHYEIGRTANLLKVKSVIP